MVSVATSTGRLGRFHPKAAFSAIATKRHCIACRNFHGFHHLKIVTTLMLLVYFSAIAPKRHGAHCTLVFLSPFSSIENCDNFYLRCFLCYRNQKTLLASCLSVFVNCDHFDLKLTLGRSKSLKRKMKILRAKK